VSLLKIQIMKYNICNVSTEKTVVEKTNILEEGVSNENSEKS